LSGIVVIAVQSARAQRRTAAYCGINEFPCTSPDPSAKYRTRSDGRGRGGGGGGGGRDCGCRCCDNWIGAQECGESPDDRPTDRPPAVQSSGGGFLAMSPGDRSRRAAGRYTTGPPARRRPSSIRG